MDQRILDAISAYGETFFDWHDFTNQEIARAALIDAIQAGWQPIETAPHGKSVLVGWHTRRGHWQTARCCFYEAGTLPLHDDAEETEDGYAEAGWYEESTTAESIMAPRSPPTHWMHLPPPPKG